MTRDQGIRARQRAQTRRTLLREGGRAFAELGYAGVGLAGIVQAAGVTKGAFYHHFASKTELFHAVLEEAQEEVGRRVAAAADVHDDPWDRLVAGCGEFLAAATDPDLQRIMLVDGPAVLGWAQWRALDEAASGRHLADALTELIDAGSIAPQPVEPLVHLLSGAMNEAALWLASTPGPGERLDQTRAALAGLLGALRADAG
ncbi:TetR/AcrR family transcriptional regulator [Streptomyces sp. NPDC048290]|uniref:TetR/AcrR family transcriptional regulator n=1 Tax=Streptomyces sp. NPDC048290 TaxID=3155811 RepID=UPI0034366A95